MPRQNKRNLFQQNEAVMNCASRFSALEKKSSLRFENISAKLNCE